MSRTIRTAERNRNTYARMLNTSVYYKNRVHYSRMIDAYDGALDAAIEDEARRVEAARELVMRMQREIESR